MSSEFYPAIERNLNKILNQAKVAEFEIIPASTDEFPLFLFLTLNLDKIGFAIINGKPEEDYARAFEILRRTYAKNSTTWAKYDLTLVLCIPDKRLVPDEFCIKYEHDAYFCRKFFLDLNKDIEIQLCHLSFMPLSPKTIGIKRPVSAQTFLMQHEVKSSLSRSLAVPHARGIEGIIEECKRGNFGEPVWIDKKHSDDLTMEDERKESFLRIKELEISNFRAYRGNHKFNLDADLIVLFGPNGLGKTSFFDAIDFICTGGIARLDARLGFRGNRLTNALKHLDASIEDTYIKATIIGKEERTIQRNLKDSTKALIEKTINDRSKLLMYLSRIVEKPIDLRVDNFVRLFRSTHLFGQEFQSLTSELQHNSKLPEDIVSRMLAFEDYVEAINKSERVVKEIIRGKSKSISDVESQSQSLKKIEEEISKLKKLSKIIEEPKALEDLGFNLIEKVKKQFDASIEMPKRINANIIKNIRVLLDNQRTRTKKNFSNIEKLVIDFQELEKKQKDLKNEEKILIKLTLDHKKISKNLSDNESNHFVLKEEISQIKERVGKWSLQKANFEWLRKNKLECAQIIIKITNENEIQKQILENLIELVQKIENEELFIIQKENEIVDLTSGNEQIEKEIDELAEFESVYLDLPKILNLQKEVENKSSNMKKSLVVKKQYLNNFEKKLTNNIIEAKEKESQINELHYKQTEFKTLLDKIEKYIDNMKCPVCGAVHDSHDKLLENLSIQRGMKPEQLINLNKAHQNILIEQNNYKSEILNCEREVNNLKNDAEILDDKLQEINEDATKITNKANSLAINLAENVVEIINSKRKILIEKRELKTIDFRNKNTQLRKQKEKIKLIKNRKLFFNHKLETSEKKKNELELLLNSMRKNATNKRFSLEETIEEIDRNIEKTQLTLSDLRTQFSTKQNKLQELQTTISNIKRDKKISEIRIENITRKISELNSFISNKSALLNQFKFNLNTDLPVIKKEKESIKNKLSIISELIEEFINFELSLDEAQKSASNMKLNYEKEKIIKSINKLDEEIKQLNNWLLFFQNVKEKLQLVRNKALNEYTKNYGPFASEIQKRMRSVYSFGPISLHQQKSEIAVHVKRGKVEEYFPSDFFSASQMNIVALSIFMSAALTQTWSSFAPILLDDPVTHFDELNAYSFVDLIRGIILQNKPGKSRQFIISTCEKKLYHLFKEKFKPIEKRVKFYEYQSIGENGPVVKSS